MPKYIPMSFRTLLEMSDTIAVLAATARVPKKVTSEGSNTLLFEVYSTTRAWNVRSSGWWMSGVQKKLAPLYR